jgi:hypothetical protein
MENDMYYQFGQGLGHGCGFGWGDIRCILTAFAVIPAAFAVFPKAMPLGYDKLPLQGVEMGLG